MTDVAAKIAATPGAVALIERLKARHGALSLHVSGSYGVSVVCLAADELRLGSRDVAMGEVLGVPVYMLSSEVKHWRGGEMVFDVAKGRAAGFSLDAPEGMHFTLRKQSCAIQKLKEAVGVS